MAQLIFERNKCINKISKITGVTKCGADQFQCKAGVCIYSDNANCNGPCILASWANDNTEDCSDGSDEEKDFDYDYDYDDGYVDDADDNFMAFTSKFSDDQSNTVDIPKSNKLKVKV